MFVLTSLGRWARAYDETISMIDLARRLKTDLEYDRHNNPRVYVAQSLYSKLTPGISLAIPMCR